MYVNSVPSYYHDVNDINFSLVEPDGGPYALRYIWMKHRHENLKFVQQYFKNGIPSGVNVRHLTNQHANLWSKHNSIFVESANNGNLIWRVKILNEVNNSIDYIEVWKSIDVVHTLLEDNSDWNIEEMNELRKVIWEAGFRAQKWSPFPTVSVEWAVKNYNIFLEKAISLQNCVINTPMKI